MSEWFGNAGYIEIIGLLLFTAMAGYVNNKYQGGKSK